MTLKRAIRWGILGTGKIAHRFVEGLQLLKDAELLAVGSRQQSSADNFGRQYGTPRRYGSYADLANDADIDVIYIATPHPMHYPNTKLCLEAGKAVLCEKPFTVNAAETAELIRIAREKQLFLMEGMWVRFTPLFQQIKERVDSGEIGELRMIQSHFGYRFPWQPENRALNPALAGGALLDVGVYPISLASFILGKEPQEIRSTVHIGASGVDEQAAITFRYDNGELALLSCAVRTETIRDSFLFGTDGYIQIYGPWHQFKRATVYRNAKSRKITAPLSGNGFNYEAAEVMRSLRNGEAESPVMPLDESLSIMKTMDKIRAQWNLRYPFE